LSSAGLELPVVPARARLSDAVLSVAVASARISASHVSSDTDSLTGLVASCFPKDHGLLMGKSSIPWAQSLQYEMSFPTFQPPRCSADEPTLTIEARLSWHPDGSSSSNSSANFRAATIIRGAPRSIAVLHTWHVVATNHCSGSIGPGFWLPSCLTRFTFGTPLFLRGTFEEDVELARS
jgi:hypothetical protein